MLENTPKQIDFVNQNGTDPSVAQISVSAKEPSLVSSSLNQQSQPDLPKSFRVRHRKSPEEQRVKLKQQMKEWVKNNMRQQMRQEFLKELQPEMKKQFSIKVREMIGMFKQIINGTYKVYQPMEQQPQPNQPNVQQQHVEKILPQIFEMSEEHQQGTELNHCKKISRRLDRITNAKRRRHRSRENRSDSSNKSESSSDSSDSRVLRERVEETVQFAIDTALDLYRKRIKAKYILVPRRKT